MFHTFINLRFKFFQYLNSCSCAWLLDPFAFANFKSPSNSYCFTNFWFFSTFGILFYLSPYSFYCLDLHLLLPKKFKIKIFKNNNIFLNFDIYRKQRFHKIQKFHKFFVFLFLFFKNNGENTLRWPPLGHFWVKYYNTYNIIVPKAQYI